MVKNLNTVEEKCFWTLMCFYFADQILVITFLLILNSIVKKIWKKNDFSLFKMNLVVNLHGNFFTKKLLSKYIKVVPLESVALNF